jgi:hypothetical protein
LVDAAGLIRSKGWTQNVMEDHYGRLCMVGAIRQAADRAYGWELFSQAVKAVARLTAPGKWSLQGVSDWNDMPGRRQREVIDLLLAAAFLASEQPEEAVNDGVVGNAPLAAAVNQWALVSINSWTIDVEVPVCNPQKSAAMKAEELAGEVIDRARAGSACAGHGGGIARDEPHPAHVAGTGDAALLAEHANAPGG